MATAKEKLTSLADAVRALTGESSPLSLDGMTALLNGLSPSGLPDGMDIGTLSLSESVIGNETEEGFAIPHRLGKIPNFVFIWLADSIKNGRTQWRAVLKCNMGDDVDSETGQVSPSEFYAVGMRMSNYSHTTATLDTYGLDTPEVFYLPFYQSTVYKANCTYKWIALRLEE